MQTESNSITTEAIAAMDRTIRPYIRTTPVLDMDGTVLKLESMQVAGSFKTRGAFANLLTRAVPAAGVVAASGGNHGAGVAYAAHVLGIPCKIFVPETSSPTKIARIRESGAELILAPGTYDDVLEASVADALARGAMQVHAFDQVETILGQGTVGKELSEQAPMLDTILVPAGGGGLLAGICAWYAGRVRIVGVEPEGAPSLTYARAAGKPADAPTGSVAHDSLASKRIGSAGYPLIERFLHDALLVSDDEIMAARKALWQNARIVAEPGGATAYAAILAGKYRPAEGERVAAIVSGGNTVVTWT